MKASVRTAGPFDSATSKTELAKMEAIPPVLTVISGTKARVISVSTLYVTVELLEPTNLQPGQTVSVSHE